MAIDSNMPFDRVNVQSNTNDTIWNGAAWGAGAGIGAMGLTYGATVHGAPALDNLNWKAAGNKTTRMQTRNQNKMDYGLQEKMIVTNMRSANISNTLGVMQDVGSNMFGSKRAVAGSLATGLIGGMMIGAGVDALK